MRTLEQRLQDIEDPFELVKADPVFICWACDTLKVGAYDYRLTSAQCSALNLLPPAIPQTVPILVSHQEPNANSCKSRIRWPLASPIRRLVLKMKALHRRPW